MRNRLFNTIETARRAMPAKPNPRIESDSENESDDASAVQAKEEQPRQSHAPPRPVKWCLSNRESRE